MNQRRLGPAGLAGLAAIPLALFFPGSEARVIRKTMDRAIQAMRKIRRPDF